MTNQALQNDENNRDKKAILKLQKRLHSIWQGRQESNLRPPVLETGALPTELLPYTVKIT